MTNPPLRGPGLPPPLRGIEARSQASVDVRDQLRTRGVAAGDAGGAGLDLGRAALSTSRAHNRGRLDALGLELRRVVRLSVRLALCARRGRAAARDPALELGLFGRDRADPPDPPADRRQHADDLRCRRLDPAPARDRGRYHRRDVQRAEATDVGPSARFRGVSG